VDLPTAVRRRLQWRRGLGFWTTTALIAVGLIFVLPATASHPEASLPGSNFEIDVDANLKVDDPAPPSIDWASVAEARQNDLATGPNDDSYAGGAKEDDVCPGTTTGSIPNQKSDLLTFGAYVEPEASGPGFLNLFWTRVQEPSGTTLMDFELNQSSTLCANGVNPVRTVGDLLIEYRIEQGGATANLRVRQWNGSAWGPAQDLSAVGAATGTINSSPIPAADSDGLSSSDPLSPRTFGEAQLDLDFVLDKTKCQSFGSAFLKSRASDSFTSQLKDFIKPVSLNIANCATVIIRKVTDPPSDPSITRFGYTKSFGTDPASENTFTLGHGENKTFDNVLFGSGYTVVEDNVPAGWDFVSVNCGASVGVTPSINGPTVTFAIDSPSDVLDCTYTNQARGVIVVVKITDDGFGPFDFTSNTLSPSPFTLTTTAPGEAGKDLRTFADLMPGTYDVAESVPPGWTLVSSSCSDGSDPGAIHLGANESITCTFHDARQKGAILITKTRKHAAGGSGNQPHPGVVFTVSGGSLPAGAQVTTGDNGTACLDGLVLSSFVGDYTVVETIPSGYHAAGDTTKTVSVIAEATCASGPKADVSFHNTPLTNVTVSVDSQVDGGTASTITCDSQTASTGPNGDGSLTLSNLEPKTVNCTIVIDP
jgi:hypothetical protein